MNKFNEVAQTVLSEAELNPKIGKLFERVSKILEKKGFKAFEQDPILQIVRDAIKLGWQEGYKAAEENPFR